jgi:pilus assembly protein CpaE
MTAASKPTRVVAIGEPSPTQDQIINALGSSAQVDFELVDVIVPSENLVRDIRAADPKLIIIDYQTGEQSILDIIDDLSVQIPEIAIVAIIPGNDPLVAQQVTLAGARAFLVHPFTQINLLSTLRRVREIELRHARLQPAAQEITADHIGPMKAIAVYSPRGGVGCSTVAVNLAIALKERTDQRVLLLGGKLFFGHLGLMLNLRTNNSIADLVPHAAQLDDALIQDVIAGHISGIDVLLEPFDFQVAQGIRPQEIYNILLGLKRVYNYIVIDVGSELTENAVTLMDTSDRILLVTTPDLASLHNTKRFIDISRSLDYQPGKLLITLNRVGMPGGIKSKDVASSVNQELFAEIPNDDARVLRSLNRGIPLLLRYPRSPASKAIYGLVSKLEQRQDIVFGTAGVPATLPAS